MVAWSLSFCRSVYKRAVLSLLPSPVPPRPPVCVPGGGLAPGSARGRRKTKS